MKHNRQLNSTRRRLGLLTIAALLGGLVPNARADVFLNETFESPMLDIVGWEYNTLVSERDFVDGVGVGGSRAMQMAGYFDVQDLYGWMAMMYLNPTISGNADATLANTVMSFDVKTDVAGALLSVGLQSWPGNWYAGTMGFSVGSIPIGTGAPGEFQTITVNLADPVWALPFWDPSQTDPFHPNGGTIQVYFQAESWNFGGPDTDLTVTVDNLRFWTVKLVPYKSSVQVEVVSSEPLPGGITEQVLEGKGISSHMGEVTVWARIEIDAGEYDPAGPSWVSHFSGIEIETAANGDTVESVIQGIETVPLPVPSPFMGYITGTRTVTGGTGRFLGATGSMTLSGVDSDGVTLEVKGVISTVGSGERIK